MKGIWVCCFICIWNFFLLTPRVMKKKGSLIGRRCRKHFMLCAGVLSQKLQFFTFLNFFINALYFSPPKASRNIFNDTATAPARAGWSATPPGHQWRTRCSTSSERNIWGAVVALFFLHRGPIRNEETRILFAHWFIFPCLVLFLHFVFFSQYPLKRT